MKKGLIILLLTSGFFTFAGGLFGPIYAIFVEEIGGDLLTAGGAVAAYAIVSGVLIYLIGRWEDRVEHQEKLVLIGYGLSAVGYFGYLFVQVPWHLFAVQIVFGLGAAISTPAYDSLYSKFLDEGKFASEWGAWEASTSIIGGVAAILGAWLATLYGFHALFVVMLGLSLLGLAVLSFLLKK